MNSFKFVHNDSYNIRIICNKQKNILGPFKIKLAREIDSKHFIFTVVLTITILLPFCDALRLYRYSSLWMFTNSPMWDYITS